MGTSWGEVWCFFGHIFWGFQSYQTSNLVALGCLGCTATPHPPAFLSGDVINISKQKNPLHPWKKHLPPFQQAKIYEPLHKSPHKSQQIHLLFEVFSNPNRFFSCFFRCLRPPKGWVSEFHHPKQKPPTSTRSGTGGAVHENRPPSSSSSKSKSMKWRPLQKKNGRRKLFWGKIMGFVFFWGGKLVGGWTNPSQKIWVKMGSSSPNRDENIKCLKPPPSFFVG